MDQKNANSRWMYIDGELYHYDDELYHYGRPGMEWGKHLPGTDWWKEKIGKISNYYNQSRRDYLEKTARGANASGSDRTINGATRAKATINALRDTARYVGRGVDRNYINPLRNKSEYNARKYYEDSKKNKSASRTGFAGKEYSSYLDRYADKQLRDADVFLDRLSGAENNSFLDSLNLSIQTAQFNVVNGINSFLKKKGWDDEVDNFLAKILKGKSYTQKSDEDRDSTARRANHAYNVRSRRKNKAIEDANRRAVEQARLNNYSTKNISSPTPPINTSNSRYGSNFSPRIDVDLEKLRKQNNRR